MPPRPPGLPGTFQRAPFSVEKIVAQEILVELLRVQINAPPRH